MHYYLCLWRVHYFLARKSIQHQYEFERRNLINSAKLCKSALELIAFGWRRTEVKNGEYTKWRYFGRGESSSVFIYIDENSEEFSVKSYEDLEKPLNKT